MFSTIRTFSGWYRTADRPLHGLVLVAILVAFTTILRVVRLQGTTSRSPQINVAIVFIGWPTSDRMFLNTYAHLVRELEADVFAQFWSNGTALGVGFAGHLDNFQKSLPDAEVEVDPATSDVLPRRIFARAFSLNASTEEHLLQESRRRAYILMEKKTLELGRRYDWTLSVLPGAVPAVLPRFSSLDSCCLYAVDRYAGTAQVDGGLLLIPDKLANTISKMRDSLDHIYNLGTCMQPRQMLHAYLDMKGLLSKTRLLPNTTFDVAYAGRTLNRTETLNGGMYPVIIRGPDLPERSYSYQSPAKSVQRSLAGSNSGSSLRIALQFSGQPRVVEGINSECIISSIVKRYQTDVYAHFWWTEQKLETSPWTGLGAVQIPRANLDAFQRIYSPKSMVVESPLPDAAYPNRTYNRTSHPRTKINLFSMYTSMARVQELMEQNMEEFGLCYDWIIRARVDAVPLRFPQLEHLNSTFFYGPNWHQKAAIANHILLSPPDLANSWNRAVYDFDSMYDRGAHINDEEFAFFRLEYLGAIGRTRLLPLDVFFPTFTRDGVNAANPVPNAENPRTCMVVGPTEKPYEAIVPPWST